MRLRGLTLALLFLSAITAWAQQPMPVTGGTLPIQPIVPAAAPAPSNLDIHLSNWEKTMSNMINCRFEIEKSTKDPVFGKERKYTGVALCMKPNLAILRFDFANDPTKTDYEAYICNGKSLFRYSGIEKTVTELKLPNPGAPDAGMRNVMLDFVSGLKAKEAKQRFDITIFKEDDNYIYLNIKPLLAEDKAEFQQLNMALYGPKLQKLAYLPCKVLKMNNNGETETWEFKNPQTNLPGIEERNFQYVQVPGFTFKQWQPPPPTQPQRPGQAPVLQGATNLPAGPGAVKP